MARKNFLQHTPVLLPTKENEQMDDDTAANLFSEHIENVLISFIQKLRHEGKVFGFSDFITEQLIKEKFKNLDDVIERTDPYKGYE